MSETTQKTYTHIPPADVAAFIAAHGTPYDPESDDYRRPPFAAPVKAGKRTSIYNAHPYHTKVPPQGIIAYIKHYTDPGDLVMDPFCGTGMTGVACRMTGRNAIISDLAPAATHIAYNYCTPVDVVTFQSEFKRVQAAVKEEFDWLYSTTCDRCSGPATIQYTIWSDVYECGRCREPLVLWDVAIDPETGKVKNNFTCPVCSATWRKTNLRWLKSVPVVTNYECHRHCKPKRANHPTTEAEKKRIAEIEAAEIPYWYPTTPFDKSWEMWRGAHRDQGITDVSKFYTKRNLWAVASLWAMSETAANLRMQRAIRFALTGLMLSASRMNRHRPTFTPGILTGTLYIGSFVEEANVARLLRPRIKKAIELYKQTESLTSVLCRTGSATDLAPIPKNSVDFIFTDPPFGSNIFYADCNLIWESWLGQFTDQTSEAVVHIKHKDKNILPDYGRLMTASFTEMFHVLKPGRWASVVFHNSDERIWQTILDAAETAGFELTEINSFDKKSLTFKGIRGDKGLERVTNQDIVLNLYKPRPHQSRSVNGVSHSEDLEAQIVQQVADFLASNPPPSQRTLQHLWNHALYDMLSNGAVQVSMADVDRMLPYYFKQVDGRWYLQGEAIVGGRVFDIRNETDAIAWLTAVLTNESQTTGKLIPKWQKVTYQAGDAITKSLDQILEENFWQERRTGQWRIPTGAERDKMSARQEVADQARVRQIRRYVAGELDLSPTSAELCGWIQFAYEHEMFTEAVRLFAGVHEPDVDEELYRKTRKIVQVCQMRTGRTEDEEQPRLL